MIKIPLTQGEFALIDDDDYELVSEYKWQCFLGGKHDQYAYAGAHKRKPDGSSTTIRMHRLILNAKSGQRVDHINGNGLDNRRSNLRLCNAAENARNQRPRLGTSRFKGVIYRADRKKWQARIRVNYRCIHLGFFDNEMDAAKAYDTAALKHFGEFARPNFTTKEKAALGKAANQTI